MRLPIENSLSMKTDLRKDAKVELDDYNKLEEQQYVTLQLIKIRIKGNMEKN